MPNYVAAWQCATPSRASKSLLWLGCLCLVQLWENVLHDHWSSRISVRPRNSWRNPHKTCRLQTLLHPPQKLEPDEDACETRSDVACSNKSQHARLKTVVTSVQMTPSFNPVMRRLARKSSFDCRLRFDAKLRRSLPVCPAPTSLILLFLSFAQRCRCFVQQWHNLSILSDEHSSDRKLEETPQDLQTSDTAASSWETSTWKTGLEEIEGRKQSLDLLALDKWAGVDWST